MSTIKLIIMAVKKKKGKSIKWWGQINNTPSPNIGSHEKSLNIYFGKCSQFKFVRREKKGTVQTHSPIYRGRPPSCESICRSTKNNPTKDKYQRLTSDYL